MHYYEVAPLQIIRPNSDSFTYCHSEPLKPGQIVTIEVGRKKLIGIVMCEVKAPSYITKPVESVIESEPVPEQLLSLAKWLSQYYATHLALVLQATLPRGLQKKRRIRTEAIRPNVRHRTKNVLTDEQQRAIENIEKANPGTTLLHGITGSGKTTVYLELAAKSLAAQKSVIVLVPEISLTTQITDEFAERFPDVVLTHSQMTEAQRHTIWLDILHSKQPKIIIGPRSALFMPLHSIGLIIIDEAHEPSFKQEQSPRYSALRAASVLAMEHGAKLILGSATPLVSDYYIATTANYPIIKMKKTARPSVPPAVTLIDMKNRTAFSKHRFLSDKLIEELERTFSSGHQALIFHNRRGSAAVTLCENCGWQAICKRCHVPMALHADYHILRCHICNNTEKVPTDCPVCENTNIIHKGIGTKLVTNELQKLFPAVTVARFDGDITNGQTVHSRYESLYNGAVNLIIGTQVVAKGLDLPNLRTVGVIQADSGLALPDFGASERAFQLLAQVVGRVGRNDQKTSVIVQTYQPSHPAIIDGLSQNYMAFYEKTIAERKRSHFPPFTFLLKLTCVYKTEESAIRNAQILARNLRKSAPLTVEILGPTPAFYERQHNTYRWQLLLKSPKRSELINIIKQIPPSHWQFELDPISLL